MVHSSLQPKPTPHKSFLIMSTTALSLDQAASMRGTHGAGEQRKAKQNGGCPDERDVLLGRGKKYSSHPGNALFCGTILDFARAQ
jgi:hypothetical protein